MQIDILTIFPDVFAPLEASILKRAQNKGLVEIATWDLRDFTKDKHRKVDDTPYGGGKGMVLQCEPLFLGIEAVKEKNPAGEVILMTPQGTLFSQDIARELSRKKGLIFVCGHYEGVDERVSSLCDYEISVGDYVLTGGEIPAMVITDCVVRLLPGVLPEEAPVYDSFYDCLLDWPCYTRPANFRGAKVPEVLLSGNHEEIQNWRRKQCIKRTKARRPELYRKFLDQGGRSE